MRRTDRSELTPAYVLHSRPHGDASRILDCLARDHGRITLMARGVRRQGAALRGVLRPFQPLLLSWVARGEMGTLTGAEGAVRLPTPTGDSLFAAFYANELLLRALAPHDPHPRVFEAYAMLLAQLCGGEPPEAPLRAFEMALLEDIGYATELSRCVDDGAAVIAGRQYTYRPAEGVREAVAGEEQAFDGSVLLALADHRFDDTAHLAEARRVTRIALDHALGQRPLRSRAVLRQVRRVTRRREEA